MSKFNSSCIIEDSDISVRIQAYNLVDYLTAIVEATQQGYKLDLKSNEMFPQQIGVVHTVGMTLLTQAENRSIAFTDESSKEEPVVVAEDKPKMTRRAKAQSEG